MLSTIVACAPGPCWLLNSQSRSPVPSFPSGSPPSWAGVQLRRRGKAAGMAPVVMPNAAQGSVPQPAAANPKPFSTGSILETLELLRKTGKDELPKELTVGETERSVMRHDEWEDLASIPVIDLAQLKTDRAGVVGKMGKAVTEWGFFQLVNHGLGLEVLEGVQSEGFKFFELPLEAKERAGTSENGRGPYIGDNTKQSVSSLHWAESLIFMPEMVDQIVGQVWPKGNEEFRSAVADFSSGADVVAKKLLELIAECLALPTDFFAKHFNEKRVHALRWNFYPACPRPTDSIGAAAHTDGTTLTLLLQDSTGGLQIKKGDEWVGIRPVEGAIVVNCGDILHAWTNGICKSVLHRVVVNKEVNRLSVACFLNVEGQLPISAPEEIIDDSNPRRYRTLTPVEYIIYTLENRHVDKTMARNGVAILEENFKVKS